MLSMFCHDNPREWDRYLRAVVQAYSATPHPSTGVKPIVAMIGWKPHNFMDLEFPPIDDGLSNDVKHHIQQERHTQEVVKTEILNRIRLAQESQVERITQTVVTYTLLEANESGSIGPPVDH
jgi:hypothetical protein